MSAPRRPRDSGCYHREPAPEHDVGVRPCARERRHDGLADPKLADCDTSRYWRCASLSASSDRVEIEISVERNRDSGRMLPLARFQEGLFNERRDFGLAHLDSDA